jgi:nucleotide-binding universal stress UspA family protein
MGLIVMCTQGRTTFARRTMDSVAGRLLRGSRTPIVLVGASS